MTSLSQTSALVLVCDKNTSYQSSKAKDFLSHLDLSEGWKMYNKIQQLQPHLDEVIPNRKFLIHNYIREVLNKKGTQVQVVTLACGWDPLLVKMSEEFPENSFFGIDRESVELQKKLVKKIMPQSSIFYLNGNISDSQKLIHQLSEVGWKKNKPTCIIIEGISYYIPPEIFWKTLKILRENIHEDCFICGDFLVNWKEQNLSPASKNLAKTIFDMIKENCSQNYYPYTTKQMEKNMESLNFRNIQFYTQEEIQKQRTGKSKPWETKEGHIQLFKAQN